MIRFLVIFAALFHLFFISCDIDPVISSYCKENIVDDKNEEIINLISSNIAGQYLADHASSFTGKEIYLNYSGGWLTLYSEKNYYHGFLCFKKIDSVLSYGGYSKPYNHQKASDIINITIDSEYLNLLKQGILPENLKLKCTIQGSRNEESVKLSDAFKIN